MSRTILNRELLPGNDCFACGHENPHGLHIEVTRDASSQERLTGRFEPPAFATGFPGLTHGGALFSAMDCLATWVMVELGPDDASYWLLGSADVSFRKPARPGEPLVLAGWLVEQDDPDGTTVHVVHAEIRNGNGDLVTEGEFREIPVTPEKFRHLAGVEEIPRAWQDLFEGTDDDAGRRRDG